MPEEIKERKFLNPHIVHDILKGVVVYILFGGLLISMIQGEFQTWVYINLIGWLILILGILFIIVGVMAENSDMGFMGIRVGLVGAIILGITYIYKFFRW